MRRKVKRKTDLSAYVRGDSRYIREFGTSFYSRIFYWSYPSTLMLVRKYPEQTRFRGFVFNSSQRGTFIFLSRRFCKFLYMISLTNQNEERACATIYPQPYIGLSSRRKYICGLFKSDFRISLSSTQHRDISFFAIKLSHKTIARGRYY